MISLDEEIEKDKKTRDRRGHAFNKHHQKVLKDLFRYKNSQKGFSKQST